jgi:predicted small metal-binding protein
MKEFSCGAVVPGCSAVFRAPDDDGILIQVAAHARQDHGMEHVPPAIVEQVRAAIVAA